MLTERTKRLISTNICVFKFNNKNTSKRREICSKLTIKTVERCCSVVFMVNLNIFQLKLLLLILTKASIASIASKASIAYIN